MKIKVQVKIRSKMEGVEKNPDDSFTVRVNVPPIEGKANKRVIELLAKFLGLPKTQVRLVRGAKGKSKIFEV